MYSLVLMAALTTGGETPMWGHHGRGCCGCCGGYSCCGGCYGGWGYSCCGCCGGCWGCCGGCWGCCGGCWGCCGGCWGSCYGCYGGVVSSYPMMAEPAGGMGNAPAPAENVPAPMRRGGTGTGTGTGGGGSNNGGTNNGGGDQASLDRAKVIVDLPSDAQLYVDGRLMKTSSAHRVFSTPTLDRGQLYYYELRAEVTRAGKTFSQEKRVIVAAGQQVQASFNDMGSNATVRADKVEGR